MHYRSIDILDEIRKNRTAGKVTACLVEIHCEDVSDRVLIDNFVLSLQMRPLADKWRKTSRDEAREICAMILNKDLAYEVEILPEEQAHHLAMCLVEHFSTDARFYTNGNFLSERRSVEGDVHVGASWDPLTEATFDTGIVIVDQSKACIVWVEDED